MSSKAIFNHNWRDEENDDTWERGIRGRLVWIQWTPDDKQAYDENWKPTESLHLVHSLDLTSKHLLFESEVVLRFPAACQICAWVTLGPWIGHGFRFVQMIDKFGSDGAAQVFIVADICVVFCIFHL